MQRDFVKNKRILNSEWNSIEIAASQNIVRNIYWTTTPVFLVWSAVSICIKSKCEWNVSDIYIYKANSAMVHDVKTCTRFGLINLI